MSFPPADLLTLYHNMDFPQYKVNMPSGGVLPNYPTLDPNNALTIPRADSNPPDGEADVAAVPVPISGGGGEQPPGLSSLGPFNSENSQGTFHVLDTEQFHDSPYVPPRTRAVPPAYPAQDPRYVQHQYAYGGSHSPADPHNSVDWSTSSPSSTSSQPLNDYGLEVISQYTQTTRPLHVTSSYPYYPAFQGPFRVGLEHVRFPQQIPNTTSGSYYRTASPSYLTDGLIAPETYGNPTAHATAPSMNYSVPSSSISAVNRPSNVSAFPAFPSQATEVSFPDAGPYLRKQLGLAAHEDVSLQSLPDPAPGEKPSTPLPMLIKLAIYSSPKKQLTLQEIYVALENRFQWFRDHKNDKAWKNSIRHNLSLNKVFQHVARPITEPGKGNYWQLDVSGGEGYKRTRKRRPKNRMIVSEEEDEATSDIDDENPSPGPSRSTPVEEAHIDPELRSEGHVVGEGRTRSIARRTGTGSPYPQQSPRPQQGPLPMVPGQDAGTQPMHRFGQPTFNFSPYSQPQGIPSSSSFSDVQSPSAAATAPVAAQIAPPSQLQHAVLHDLHQSPSQSGVAQTMISEDPRATARSESREYAHQARFARPSSPGSSTSESSRTWNEARSRSQ